jgi:diadenosine tetraphosphate (Ap4A) HIT family hydrolase
MPDFLLDPRLKADTLTIADWPLSRVLLINDSRFPWLVLVPRRDGVTDLIDLDMADRMQLMAEIERAARALRVSGRCDKLNVASLGNMVAQLHIHVIARTRDDAAWPKPVWGVGEPVRYPDARIPEALARALAA